MDETQLHDELNTLLFNGYEDVGGSLAWTLYLLAQNPNSAAQLQAEIEQLLGGRVPVPGRCVWCGLQPAGLQLHLLPGHPRLLR